MSAVPLLRPALLACGVALAAMPIQAQRPGTIAGRVRDAITGDPVQHVTIGVVGSTLSVETSDDGTYELAGIPPGLVRIEATMLGYIAITTPYYTVLPDSTTTADFRLAPVAFTLEPVEVIGEREVEESNFGSTVLTPERLPARGDLLNALQGSVAGLRVGGDRRNPRTYVRGSNAEVLYVIDGTVFTPPLTISIDVRDVECVEVRRGYQAALEFAPPGLHREAYSGVILIWTRGSVGRKPEGCTPPR